VAPAFLASSKKPATERKMMAMDESIPALFNDARPPVEKPAPEPVAPVAPVVPEPVAEPLPEPAAAEAAPASVQEAAPVQVEQPAEQPPAAEQPAIVEPPAAAEPQAHVEQPSQVQHTQEQSAHQQHTQAAAQATAHEHPAEKLPETVGEIFHQPQKQHWTPAEIVSGTVTLPGVAGAIVALQEGLVVSASLPEGVKSDVIAAFLPQIFARLNLYAGEMRLGDVDDLLFTTHGAHCQIYRLGYIYFAVLGKTGESLPWHELRLLTEELARQTQK
jgi:predicted regulator of Ras-like GTPase activity (Roadblock/LC7/MglB family)